MRRYQLLLAAGAAAVLAAGSVNASAPASDLKAAPANLSGVTVTAKKAPPVVSRLGIRAPAGADLSSDIAFALILGDRNQISNAKIGPVATISPSWRWPRWQGLERCNAAVPTLLNLMAGACQEDPPETATAYDVNLLKGLYLVNPRESGSQQRMEIADRIVRATAEAETAAR